MRRLVWLGLFFVAAVLYGLARNAYWVGFFNDDAFYLIGARSLCEGRFAELNHPAQPPLIQYLPGYPLLLAPLAALFPGAWLPAQILSVLLGLASAAAAAWAFAEDLDENGRLLLAALCLFNPLALSLSGAVLADVPFTLAVLLTLGAARRAWPRAELGVWAALGLAAGASALIRPTGLALMIALPAALAWERRGRAAAAAAASALLVLLPWLLRNFAVRGHPLLYGAELTAPLAAAPLDAVRTGLSHIGFYLCEMYARTLLRWPIGAPSAAVAAAAALAGLSGGLLGLRRTGLSGGRRPALICAVVLSATLLVWGKRSTRYLLPLIPFAAAWGLAGLGAAEARLRRPGLRLAAGALALASFLAPAGAIISASTRRDAPPARAPERTFAWIRENTPANAVFACELDGQLYLRTGRRSVTLPRGRENNLAEWVAASGVAYLLVCETADILRTPRGMGPHDPIPDRDRRAAADGAASLTRVFVDDQEGTAVYARN